MKKSTRLIAIVAAAGALGVAAASPATAGEPAPGSVYKGTYAWDVGMTDKMRVKVYESGKAGNFTLDCAGIERARFEINRRGRFHLEFGADEVMFKGHGRFASGGRVKGEVDKNVVPDSTCGAPGEFLLVIQDV